MKIRMKFSKQGALKFVGHLDTLRYFQKVMRRASVDIRYSEGFSPHQIMSFASPLGVGLTSNGEYVDIEVNSTKDSKTMVEQINAANVDEIRILSYRRLDDSAKNAMSMVAAADYTMWFREGSEPENLEQWLQEFLTFCQSESIEVVKKTKKGVKTMDLRPYLYEIRLCEDPTRVFMKLSAGSTANVKPEQVLAAFYASRGEEYPPFAIQFQREEVYGDEGTEEQRKLKPLEEYGAEIE